MNTPITHPISDWLKQYEANGVARINGVFTNEEINELRCLSWKAFRDAPDGQIQWKNNFPALLFGPQGLEKFQKNERLANIARTVLGKDILQLNYQLYFRLPGDGDQFNWHQDISFRTPIAAYDQIETGYLQTAIVIDPMTRENSPIEFVLGSHKKGDLGLIPRDNTERSLRDSKGSSFYGTPMTAQPGDVLIWSVMIVHGSRKNESQLSRMYLMNGFAKTECVKINQFPVYMQNGKVV
jgi:hypothetical protein